jgi:1-acyl-sn-glycerol-3-phosphate acyltransferase
MSRLDPPLVYILIKREDLTGLAADKYKNNPLFSWLINSVNGIWLNREEADFGALREAINHLRTGGALGIAPEGTRSRVGSLIPAKTGVAYLADKAHVPIVPIAISGTEDAVRQLLRFRRPPLRVQFGEPFRLPPVDRQDRDGSLNRNTDEIMCRIAVMLPLQYRGAYTNHPRILERLNSLGQVT